MNEKKRGFRIWKEDVEKGPKKVSMSELMKAQENNCHSGGGQSPHSAVVELFERLRNMGIEEPLKYEMSDDHVAGNFATVLRQYVARLEAKDKIFVSKVNKTVYIYNKEKW